MSKEFKVGQVVKYVGNPYGRSDWFKIGTRFNVVEECKKPAHWICEKLQQVEPSHLNLFYSLEFEIVKDIQEFDMKKEKWFIRVNNLQECIAAQEWAFSKGFDWSGNNTLRTNFEDWCEPCALGFGHYGFSSLGQAEVDYWLGNNHKEIKVNFKTIIDSVEYPSIETEQQKQIRELEEKIAKAAEQIKSLKGEK